MPHLNQQRANKPGEGRAKPNSKRRRSNKQKHDKERAAKLERETEELRIAMGGEPKDDPNPLIPGFEQPLTREDTKLIKQAIRERWQTNQQVMDALVNKYGVDIINAIKNDDKRYLELGKEYRQLVAQNQRDEIAQINVGKPTNVILVTLVQRRAIAAEALSAELGKRCIPGIIGSDHRDEPGIGDELYGDDGDSEGGDEPV